MKISNISFPAFSGIRCLMMPYIQGDSDSVPEQYKQGYQDILNSLYLEKGQIGFLTIDESVATAGTPHRGARAKHGRALHTEAGIKFDQYGWGSPGWGHSHKVTLHPDVEILLANNLDDSCMLWNNKHFNTTLDGDIGMYSNQYPYENGVMMKNGEVHRIGILTPHESLPVHNTVSRQFLRIIGSGVYGREDYFTENPLMKVA